jgi:hypothetical protein
VTVHTEIIQATDLPQLYPNLNPRTIRGWLLEAHPRTVTRRGETRTLPGNGLGSAVFRRGKLYFVDAGKFHRWFVDGESFG